MTSDETVRPGPEPPEPAPAGDASERVEPSEPAEPADPAEPLEPAPAADASEPVEPSERVEAHPDAHHHGPGSRTYDVLRHLPHLPLTTRRGIVLFAFLVSGTALAGIAGAVGAVHYSESLAFCGLCHTMAPEQKALAASPHANVTCAECHVEPGVGGFVRAKINGTRQLVEVVTGTFPRPIPPADHADLPATKDTCLGCHSLSSITAGGGPTQLVLRPSFSQDRSNSRTTIAVILRPAPTRTGGALGVHWHVQKDVTYVAEDEQRQGIDLVRFAGDEGETETYIAGGKVTDSLNAEVDVDRLLAKKPRTMDCYDCHNRVGHPLKSPERALDEAMASGAIDPTLPWIKRDTMTLLSRSYADEKAADQAISGFTTAYPDRYALGPERSRSVARAAATLRTIYAKSATPEMKVVASTYPDNLGHQASAGCFRCHDGAHYRVVDGKVTTETIPSTCATCHTFPQTGLTVNNVALGAKPADHADSLWVFNHRTATSSRLPTGTSCGTCHAPSYCANCHNSGAIKVDHDTMLYNHVQSIRASGGTASCAYCHQPAYCAGCHKSTVMKPNPLSHLTTTRARSRP